MIYFFTWNSDYLVREKTNSWKKAYTEKYGDFNCTHFKDIKSIDNNILLSELLSSGFMWEKKLIIIDDIPLNASTKDSILNLKQEFLEAIIEKIPEDNIVIFSSINPDRRSKFYKKLKATATKIEEFNNSNDSDLFILINNKYKNKLDSSAINLLIKYKWSNLNKIVSEINKLLILSEYIDEKLVKENIFPELEESVFQLIDDIMNVSTIKAIEKIKIILSQTSVYAFYNNLLSNLRTLVFINTLKNTNIPNIVWVLELWNRWFLVNKSYKISSDSLNHLYIWLINLDKKMKSWKMIWSEEDILIYEIEKQILEIKK